MSIFRKTLSSFLFIALSLSCGYAQSEEHVELLVLGIAQDAGYPQAACKKGCCEVIKSNPSLKELVSSLGIIDHSSGASWLFDATPDFTEQIALLAKQGGREVPTGIFLTHAHIGHYTGLMYLGREAIGAKQMPVYGMPRMCEFLSDNGPWSQLVALKNIELHAMENAEPIQLTPSLTVTPLLVPHRDEFSETAGYLIQGPMYSALFIPDIDKWELWHTSIVEMIEKVDYAFLDGSFFDGDELPNVDMSKIPHPFIVESMSLFNSLSAEDKAKVHFMHFNHTNPLLDKGSTEYQHVIESGFKIAYGSQVVRL